MLPGYLSNIIGRVGPDMAALAVARLLAFVFTMAPVVKAAGLVHRRPASALVA